MDADLRLLIEVVARAVKAIAVNVGKGRPGQCARRGRQRQHAGRGQKKLDVIANDILIQANEWGGHLAAMASEEEVHFRIPSDYPKGGFLLLFDPLDGSSNIDVNISRRHHLLGARCPAKGGSPDRADFMQAGTAQVAAGYSVYGPSTSSSDRGRRRAWLHPRP